MKKREQITGSIGGKTRANNLTPERRREIAMMGVKARMAWSPEKRRDIALKAVETKRNKANAK